MDGQNEHIVKFRNPLGVTVEVYYAETPEEAAAMKKEFDSFTADFGRAVGKETGKREKTKIYKIARG